MAGPRMVDRIVVENPDKHPTADAASSRRSWPTVASSLPGWGISEIPPLNLR
jgi:hypothetical protein